MNSSRPSRTAAPCLARALFALLVASVLPASTRLSAQSPKAATAAAGSRWLTRPELTDYAETSRYDEVIAYMRQMAAASPQIHLTTYGYTFEGRPLPLAVIGAPSASAEQVLATKKTRVYIQGNIHAGEVEGKEALLWLLRSIARGERNEWLKTTVLLINPIYNADGNERVSVANRGSQAGPVGGMGTRENAQGLDLNRDGTKLETAEARSLASLLTRYQPHMAMDLHTTDGSAGSGFNMTYETSLNPNNSRGEMSLLRDVLLPQVTKAVKSKHGSDWFYYGGVSGSGAERAWRSDADLARPRYTSTLFGVRNILGLLTETYSYASFKTRIFETYWFLEETLGFVAKNGEQVRSVVATANGESIIGLDLAVRQQLVKAPDLKQIVFAPTVSTRNPYVPDRPYRVRTDGPVTSEMLPFYGTAEPTETSRAPRVWVVPMEAASPAGAAPAPPPPFAGGRVGGGGTPTQRMIASVADRLEAHGITYTRTDREVAFTGERFLIASNTLADREYQGSHKARTLTGAWEAVEQTLPAGSLIIPILFPSTSEVYGMCPDPVLDEDKSTLVYGPIEKQRWIYAASKQLIDRVIYAYGLRDGLDYTLFRPFNWVGPHLDNVLEPKEGSSRLFTQFISNVIHAKPLQLVDGGRQRRSFTYIDDAIDCLMRIIENKEGAATRQIINIGNPANDVSVEQLARLILEVFSEYPDFKERAARTKIVVVSAEEYFGKSYQDILVRVPSVARAFDLLGWRPTTDLKTAIRLTLDFHLSRNDLELG